MRPIHFAAVYGIASALLTSVRSSPNRSAAQE